MDIEKLRVLLSVVERGSIQGASRALGLPRSQLRRRIDGLEAEVGVPLLHRDTDGVHLTDAGHVVVERGRSILQGVERLVSDARATAGDAAGVLRAFEPIGMPLALRTRSLLAMRSALPRLRFVVRQVEDPIAHLDEPCDMALHDGPMPDRGAWFSRVVARVPLRALASPAYLAARGAPDRAAALSKHEILGWKRARESADAWPLRAGGEVQVAPWFVSHDLLLLRSLAAEGGGIVLAPQTGILDDPDAGPLVPVLEDEVGASMTFRVSTRHHTDADARTREALDHVLRALADFSEE